MTVAGWTVPSGSKTCVMPTFLPMIPVTIPFSVLGSQFSVLGSPFGLQRRTENEERRTQNGEPRTLFMFFSERLDLHVDARRQIELHQRVDGLRRRLEDVDQPLVRADLELLARLLVDVRRAEHGPLVLRRRQRNRPREPRAGALRRVDDLAGRLIEHAVVIRLEADADLVAERGRHNPD